MLEELSSKDKVVGLKQVQRAVSAGRAGRVFLACDADPRLTRPLEDRCRERGVPVVAVLGRCDRIRDVPVAAASVARELGVQPVAVSARTGAGIASLRAAVAAAVGEGADATITGDLVTEGDVVLLVMPQESAAPKGRLILPQAQTLRELLDKGCMAVCCTPDGMQRCLRSLSAPPKLVVTDSQAFAAVSAMTPAGSLLTSFSVLFAGYKGDIGLFVEGAAAIDALDNMSRVLIAEACTHAPAREDIGRVKLCLLYTSDAADE